MLTKDQIKTLTGRIRPLYSTKKARKYTGVTQFFHNYEHSPEGLTHCKGPPSNPYRITHVRGKHKITHQYAKGHGKGNKPQWFKFLVPFRSGFDLSSGTEVSGKGS